MVVILTHAKKMRSSQLILVHEWQEYRSGEDLGALKSHGHKKGHNHAH